MSPIPFRLTTCRLVLALVSALYAGQLCAAAGRVDFASGGTTISGADGRQRPLARGAELDRGDTVRTDAAGRAQIRFADGAYVSLQPNSEFSIKDYNFDGKTDGSERGFFSLARGAMRTVTGLIGRVNRNRYQVSTPTATIGIRGTGGLIAIGVDGSTLVTGTSGIWTITNPSGTIDVPAGVTGRAPAAPNQPPRQTTEKPPSQLPEPRLFNYMEADNRTPDGNSTSIASNVLKSGPGYTALMAYSPDGATSTLGFSAGGNAVFNGGGQLTSIAPPGAPAAFTLPSAFQLLDGAQADFGTDGIVAWGRWTGTVRIACDPAFPCAQTVSYGPNQGLHYVVGVPTAVLPTTGTATYAMLGATQPTYMNGSTSPGTFSGSLSVTFAPAAATVGMTFNVTMPDRSYAFSGSTTTTTALFSLSGSATSPTSCAVAGCNVNVAGTFFGPSAERAGTSYVIQDVGAGKQIVGAAAFQKQ
jgi:hypothetical protein